MKIKAVYGIQPILDIQDGISAGKTVPFGLNRDRTPDNGWSELRSTNMASDTIKEVPLDAKMKLILLQDLAYAYGQDSEKFAAKLVKFGLMTFL